MTAIITGYPRAMYHDGNAIKAICPKKKNRSVRLVKVSWLLYIVMKVAALTGKEVD